MRRFAVGDKVIQTPNRPERTMTDWTQVLNGHIGTIFKIHSGLLYVDFGIELLCLHRCDKTLKRDTGRFYVVDDPGLIKVGPQKVQIDKKYEELYT